MSTATNNRSLIRNYVYKYVPQFCFVRDMNIPMANWGDYFFVSPVTFHCVGNGEDDVRILVYLDKYRGAENNIRQFLFLFLSTPYRR